MDRKVRKMISIQMKSSTCVRQVYFSVKREACFPLKWMSMYNNFVRAFFSIKNNLLTPMAYKKLWIEI